MDDSQELDSWARSLDHNKLGELSKSQELTGKDRKFVYDVARRLRQKDSLSFKQLQYLKTVMEKIELAKLMEHGMDQDLGDAVKGSKSCEVRHLTVRLAWHDSAWNGRICKDPAANVYCVGEHSLLSERIRTRRNLAIETHEGHPGSVPNAQLLGDYMPPCFWSINAFSPHALSIIHDNPGAKEFPRINEHLPAYSVFSWPFKLSFVTSRDEKRKYGNYYPKPIFEARIEKFQSHILEQKSLVFLYCKFSNPVSGEDYQYLLVGCAFLKEKGAPRYFKPIKEQLETKQSQRGMQNFHTLNWALRYSLDVEHSGVRLPYQEYLQETNKPGGLSEALLDEMKVTITEPELTDGFAYVARHIDDDQAIYLLMKLRKSILTIKEHGFQIDYDADTALERADQLLGYVWKKRGYLPGLNKLAQAALGLSPADTQSLDALIGSFPLNNLENIERIRDCFANPSRIEEDFAGYEDLIVELAERIEELGIDVQDFLKLAALNLTHVQFDRVLRQKGLRCSVKAVCENPYLIYEEYEPGKALEDPRLGDKLDGPIDLFKIDIALFPQIRFLKRSPILHLMKISDQKRLRAVTIAVLRASKVEGHCFEESGLLQERTKQYPLFYQSGREYEVNVEFKDLPPLYHTHFQDKLVMRKEGSRTYYYLKTVFDDEQSIANTIRELISAEKLNLRLPDLGEDLEKASDDLTKTIGSRFERAQFLEERKSLYQKLPRKRFFVISGSPGSGKSYELLKLVDRLACAGEKSLILTLTGKAALRLKNNAEGFKNIDAKTIDKFLVECEALAGGNRVIPNLIIDEMSMVDLDKLAKILKIINTRSPYFKRLILVGDECQLPPIGAGKVFEDILEYLRTGGSNLQEHWTHLDVNCRAEMPQEFLSFCRIFSNQNKNYEKWISRVDTEDELCPGLSVQRWRGHQELQSQIVSRFLKLFGRKDMKRADRELALDLAFGIGKDGSEEKYTLDRHQILSPYRTGLAGASGLNLFFQEEFRADRSFSGGTTEVALKLKDKVIHTQNEYDNNDLFVSNGSLGVVIGYDKIRFVERDKPVWLRDLDHPDKLELAYAITVHKAQGSGFDHVFLIIPERHGRLSRELLYTALSRGRKSVTIFIQVGEGAQDASQLLNRIRNTSSIETRRTSLLRENDITFAYIPDSAVEVKSRVEYIIYKKLQERRASLGNFDFQYEETYELTDKPFDIHPDFTIRLASGRVIYWEHLGRLTSHSYVLDWDERRMFYKAKGDWDKVITTHELSGIRDAKISAIIEGLLHGTLRSEDSSDRYSLCHCSLG